jgi:hypothetical protein
MLPMQLTTKPVMIPIMAPNHHPIQPKIVMPMKIQSLLIAFPIQTKDNDYYTFTKHYTLIRGLGEKKNVRTIQL